MAHVVVRVEMHGNTTEEQYKRLHAAMQSRGFVRTITNGSGTKYWLPTAMYYSNAYSDAATARDAASQAAAGIASAYSVIATCGPSAWQGLQTA
jgi:hypothetical protein